MQYRRRKPDFIVEIYRPNYNSITYDANKIASFDTSPLNNALIGYNFTESLNTIETQFSLSLTAETDDDGYTWLDKIEIKDLVFIYEFAELRFIGVVEDKRFSARFSGERPSKQVSVNGLSLGNLLSTFPLVIDQFLYQGNTLAESANNQLKARLAAAMEDGYPVANIMKTIYDSFFELSLKMGTINSQGRGIKTVLDEFIDFDSRLSKDIVLKYPIALSIYNVGINNIWDILSSLMVPPVYEMFMLLNPTSGKYEGVFRQTPFEPEDWKSLTKRSILPVYLNHYDFGQSGNEVYTYFLCSVAGAGISDNKGMLLDSAGYGALASFDEEKWKKYGYRPLIIEFRYFDADKSETYTTTASTMRGLGEMLKRWYQYNDEFHTGTLRFMTIDNNAGDSGLRNPRVGEKMSFLEGEFYIEESEHSWNYGTSMETRLSLSRGFVYSGSGSPLRPINNMGRLLSNI